MDGWNVSIDSPEAKIYFEISDTDLQEWGDCPNKNVWPDSKEKVQEGNKFIHFWGVFEDQDHEGVEITQEYKYDRTAPEKFEVIMSEPFLPQPWNTNWIQRNFKVDIPITRTEKETENSAGISTTTVWWELLNARSAFSKWSSHFRSCRQRC